VPWAANAAAPVVTGTTTAWPGLIVVGSVGRLVMTNCVASVGDSSTEKLRFPASARVGGTSSSICVRK